MSVQTYNSRDRLRLLGQADLGDWIEVATGDELWSVQKRICRSVSIPRSKTTVPSCNASGKTHLAGRIAMAFYDAFTPGAPCPSCDPTGTKGGCRGSKVITTSSKEEHLKDNLWGELRMSYPRIIDRVGLPGRLYDGDMRLQSSPDHFIMGQSATSPEGMQGYHAAHKLIIGDEATAVSEEVSQGITGLLASGDARLLLIFNPSTPDTYAAVQTKSPRTTTIKITAFDTPHFTGEKIPEGSNLITPDFLADLEAQGMGPGSYEWTTRVLAEFWDLGDDILIPEEWVLRNWISGVQDGTQLGQSRQLGVDLASYGNAESVMTMREGIEVIAQIAHPSMRMDTFWRGPVLDVVRKLGPNFVCYDADGVGAGVIGYADEIQSAMVNGEIIPFRGNMKINESHTNSRSTWWWYLRRLFENDSIKLRIPMDPKLLKQLTSIHYSISAGKIRVETKDEMRKRGFESPDRGDSLVYSFALQEGLLVPKKHKPEHAVVSAGIVEDNSDRDKGIWAPNDYGDGDLDMIQLLDNFW